MGWGMKTLYLVVGSIGSGKSAVAGLLLSSPVFKRAEYIGADLYKLGLTRFRGHLTKGGYDAKYGQANRCETDAPAVS